MNYEQYDETQAPADADNWWQNLSDDDKVSAFSDHAAYHEAFEAWVTDGREHALEARRA